MADFIEKNGLYFTFSALKKKKPETLNNDRASNYSQFLFSHKSSVDPMHWAGKALIVVGLSSHQILSLRIRVEANQQIISYLNCFAFTSKSSFIFVCKITRIIFVEMGIEVFTFARFIFSSKFVYHSLFRRNWVASIGRATAKNSFIRNCKHCNEISILGGICCALVKWTVMKLDLVDYGTRHFSSIHWKKICLAHANI